ncbi:hypothetical protein TREMEDRAFT_62158 [Tremella mesenterica DSM 1558]|uniref:uncharacterized protein n=1 Tax=Tremella mesenterica (strain ATCC 24925 / CBS 8224 / DSM 1558 / NBRC 9311 / NRRL Y-6157 / RJB 2259-6 / UBC 559-6) TaxID=578456 RepID=UPI0003F4934C|nr:uncharacterized protein TREMEDRAFT_62158 [Tremella mesenterica DSM 1558]EIW69294.1 hypothetical protein TREMEDRAFT_62158 [Tremella mesenterica DSM 1558]
MVDEGGSTRAPPIPVRSRRNIVVEEDATKLQFGDLADGEALTLTDVNTLLEAARKAPDVPPPPDNKVYKSTVEYVSTFSNATPDAVESMRQAFAAHPGFLNKFEIAQIMYLRPERIEVAIALIPSLERYSQGDAKETLLQQLLDDVRNISRYGSMA